MVTVLFFAVGYDVLAVNILLNALKEKEKKQKVILSYIKFMFFNLIVMLILTIVHIQFVCFWHRQFCRHE